MCIRDSSDAAQVASALQVALFLLGEPVFMERALQQFLVLLHLSLIHI